MPPKPWRFLPSKKAGNKSDLIKLKRIIHSKQFMFGAKFLERNRHAPKTKLVGVGMGKKRWHRLLPKCMETFMFHLFSETIKCFISSIKHLTKLQRSPDYAKLSLVMFSSVYVGTGPTVIQIKANFSTHPQFLNSTGNRNFIILRDLTLSFKNTL